MRTLAIAALLILSSSPARAQAPAPPDSLLDRMVGKWILQGTIAGSATTHDVDVEWVLGHEYVRLHEVSRERAPVGAAAYEALVLIGLNGKSSGYDCLWLDSTGGGGLNAQAIGHAPREPDRLAFLFDIGGSPFHTTFVYDASANTWRWLMDGERDGKLEPFARVTLSPR